MGVRPRTQQLGTGAGVLALLALWGVLLTPDSGAQPVRHEVFDDAVVTRDGDCARIELIFNFKVQYLRHFPQWTGPSLYLQFQPVGARVPRVREAVVAHGADPGPLLNIAYDGEPGPLVIVDFSRPVAFTVGPGTRLDSLSIAYDTTGTGGQCLAATDSKGEGKR